MMNDMPSPQGGTFKALRIQGTDWSDSGFSFDRSIHLTTEFGLRTHGLSFSYHQKNDGFAPLLLIQFNFTWGLIGEGVWYNLVLKHGDQILGSLPVQRMRTEPTVDFVSAEPKDFNNMLVWLAMDIDLIAEMHGSDDVACSFPIPADSNFINVLRRVKTRMAES